MNPIKIGFVLISSERDPLPSTRVAALNMFPLLREAGFDPHVAFAPAEATETPALESDASSIFDQSFSAVVFQKAHGPSAVRTAAELSSRGIKTLYLVCDLVVPEMVEVTDATVVVTKFLRELHPVHLQRKIHVIHDGIERPDIVKTAWRTDRGSRLYPLRAVLVTSARLDALPVLRRPPTWLKISIVGRYPPRNNANRHLREAWWAFSDQRRPVDKFQYLRFLATRRITREAWDSSRVYETLCEADIGIIPIHEAAVAGSEMPQIAPWLVKSENRLTMKMAIGLPVVASPIPSYCPVISQGSNGFLAKTLDEWQHCLNLLRDSDTRRSIGVAARESVLRRYSMKEQCRLMVVLLRRVLGLEVPQSDRELGAPQSTRDQTRAR